MNTISDANADHPLGADAGGIRHYFVDEAGDLTLFNRRGRVIVGEPGCSRFFILGKLEVPDPVALAKALGTLRLELLNDPYFTGVPSMQANAGKTAYQFHAKDDLPEVRRAVFALLLQFDVRFYAIVRDKQIIVRKVLEHNIKVPSYRYHPNQLYDRCIPGLFRERLHQHASYRIIFARRGSSDRTTALRKGLEIARETFRRKWGIAASSPIEVAASQSGSEACLQATDYFLWALQRCFERQEHRYVQLLWQKIGLVLDRDDDSRSPTGEYYNRRRPIPTSLRA